jgi:hypothetical protein
MRGGIAMPGGNEQDGRKNNGKTEGSKQGQFQPGAAWRGNAGGKPKGSKSPKHTLMKILGEEIVDKNGKSTGMSKGEGLMRLWVDKAKTQYKYAFIIVKIWLHQEITGGKSERELASALRETMAEMDKRSGIIDVKVLEGNKGDNGNGTGRNDV